MTGDANKYSDAKRFCESQHSAGRVIWETQEKYLDLKYIVGRWPGRDRPAFTGLHNQMASVCNSASECDGKLVNLLHPKINCGVGLVNCFFRVPLMYQPCCLLPCCQGKLGEHTKNSLPNLLHSSFWDVVLRCGVPLTSNVTTKTCAPQEKNAKSESVRISKERLNSHLSCMEYNIQWYTSRNSVHVCKKQAEILLFSHFNTSYT